ncbi:probable polyol transporter 6 [Neltuma alba]|uniref:probable polyol transporter 6 n=1 Tax=Neltuma alba TaxID=207710 RepID=UPI0010A46DE9|nr:probable polyol transporter 6 [Prosopis alba]
MVKAAATKGGGEDDISFNKYASACAIVASMISIIFGYDTGVMSGAMIFIKEDLKISDTQVEILAGILNLCALVGTLTAGRTSDYIGRRYSIVLASILFLLGSLLMGYGPNYLVLMAGRCTAGIGVGFALLVAPVYSAEISSASSRGFLTSLPELCIGIGILLGYVSNYFFGKLPLRLGWRLMLGIAAIPSLALALGILRMPESPRWLVMRGKLGKAKKVLLQISNTTEEAELRFKDIKVAAGIDEACQEDVVKVSTKCQGESVLKELILRPSPCVRWMLITVVGIHFFEHATGIEAVMLYSPRIFKQAGVTSKDKLLLTVIGIGFTKVACLIIATVLLDKVGRRRLLLISLGGMICALSVLGFSLTMSDHSTTKLVWALGLSIASTYTTVGFFNIGLGPVTWVYSSEVFPLKLRAQGASIGVAVNRVVNASVSMSFISINKTITIGGSFFMFAGISALAWAFFFFFLPETKGKSLEEMEKLFTKNNNSRTGAFGTDPANNISPLNEEMKDDDALPTTTAFAKKESADSGLFGKGKYKFWALAAILLLALWSMFTGTVSLRWSGSLNSLSKDLDTPIHDDLDVLEMEEREKVVKHMWDVYTNSRRIRLPRFWQEAFEAAYEVLTSDAPGVREAAITEIAKMSVRSIDFDSPPIQSTRAQEFSKSLKQQQKGKEAATITGA